MNLIGYIVVHISLLIVVSRDLYMPFVGDQLIYGRSFLISFDSVKPSKNLRETTSKSEIIGKHNRNNTTHARF